VQSQGANHVDAQVVCSGMLECGTGQLCSEAAPPKRRRNLRVPDSHPPRRVGIELKICGVAILGDLESIGCSLRTVLVHNGRIQGSAISVPACGNWEKGAGGNWLEEIRESGM
jgi:hypothetical protein